MMYLQLFLEFFKTGLFAIGGGMATIPFLYEISDKTGWFTYQDLANMIAVSESTPGPIGVNMATYVGYVSGFANGGILMGLLGALIASVSVILPSLVIVTLLAYIYQKYRKTDTMQILLSGVRPAVVALIGSAAVSIFVQAIFVAGEVAIGNIRVVSVVLFAGALFLIRKMKWSPILVMALCGAANLVVELVK